MPRSTLSDDKLVARYQAGDSDAFTAIYQRYAPLLVRYAARRVGPDRAEDLVQEAMLKAARHIPRGNIYDLNSYLVLCLRQMWWRREEQARRRPDCEPFDPAARYPGTAGDVEALVCERETVAEVRALLAYLPDPDRQVAALRLLAGCDLREIGAQLGAGRTAVSSAWRRVARRLEAWAGTKTGQAALEQALRLAARPDAVPAEDRCQVRGCARPRHCDGRCTYHYEMMLETRRRRLRGAA